MIGYDCPQIHHVLLPMSTDTVSVYVAVPRLGRTVVVTARWFDAQAGLWYVWRGISELGTVPLETMQDIPIHVAERITADLDACAAFYSLEYSDES
jgi:hypothetical protein